MAVQNNVILIGRLTADPELKTTSNGVEYTHFTVAVDRYQGKDKEDTTDFIPCIAWRTTAVLINKYCKKGSRLAVQGSVQTSKYKDKDGNNRTDVHVLVDNITFCESKKTSDSLPFDM